MHTLIYLSSATYLYSDLELLEILSKSRDNNTKSDITGLLLYNDGSILQVLEGEKENIHKLFNVISKDTRHRSVIKLIDTGISERSFKDWSMGFKQLSDLDWIKLQGHLDLSNKVAFSQVANMGSSSVVSLIKSFAYVNALPIL